MTDNTEMPWTGIAKVTAAVGVVLTLICKAAVEAAKKEEAEKNRFRWTDKNRWE